MGLDLVEGIWRAEEGVAAVALAAELKVERAAVEEARQLAAAAVGSAVVCFPHLPAQEFQSLRPRSSLQFSYAVFGRPSAVEQQR